MKKQLLHNKFFRWIRRQYKLLILFFLKLWIHGIGKDRIVRSRTILREERLRKIKASKKTLFDDIYTGYKLNEFVMLPGDVKILDRQKAKPNLGDLEFLYKKYRGYKISEHPSIYNVFAKNRQTK